MTPEQLAAAKRALLDKRSKDLCKRIALHRRQWCLEMIPVFRLPYRILYDGSGADPDERPLNRYYPLPGATRDGTDLITIQTEQDAIFYLTRFLRNENFADYRPFDFTGNNLSPSELEAVRNAYTERQKDYSKHPDRYWHHGKYPNKKQPDDEKQYFCLYL